jgi:hypothetical protein
MTREIDLDHDEIEAAFAWHGGQTSMLYAAASTGALKCGTIRPKHDDDRPMTDIEWLSDLASRLAGECEECVADATERMVLAKVGDGHPEDDSEELSAQIDALQSLAEKCNAYVALAEAALPVDATLPRNPDGTLASWAWPGGYTIAYHLADGGCVCPACANGRKGSEASVAHDDKQWRIVGAGVYWEGPTMHCDHCNAEIESSYGDPDADNTEQGA